MRAKLLLTAACAVGLLGAAPNPPPPAPPPPGSPPPGSSGYLGGSAPDTYKILPPAPAPGSPRDEADRKIFKATRKLEGSKRWDMAKADDNGGLMLKHLSCAVGVELNAQTAPTLARIIPKAARDAGVATNHPKDLYKHKRPYLVDEGPICLVKSTSLAQSPDYPSGHVTFGWTVGLILAELAPDRATEILSRARAFGESRMVCGVHNSSAVEAGRTNGAIVVAALHGQPAFRADMEAARKEVAAARAAGPAPDPAACAAEAGLVAQSPY